MRSLPCMVLAALLGAPTAGLAQSSGGSPKPKGEGSEARSPLRSTGVPRERSQSSPGSSHGGGIGAVPSGGNASGAPSGPPTGAAAPGADVQRGGSAAGTREGTRSGGEPKAGTETGATARRGAAADQVQQGGATKTAAQPAAGEERGDAGAGKKARPGKRGRKDAGTAADGGT